MNRDCCDGRRITGHLLETWLNIREKYSKSTKRNKDIPSKLYLQVNAKHNYYKPLVMKILFIKQIYQNTSIKLIGIFRRNDHFKKKKVISVEKK